MATLITPDGVERDVHPLGKTFTLAELYDLIGHGCDMVQTIRLADGRIMWIDEEAKLKADPPQPNEFATELLDAARLWPGDVILGAAVITQRDEVE